MRELIKGNNYSYKDGQLYSKKHRVSFKIPEGSFGWNGRMTSERKIQLFSQDKTIRLQIYLKANIPVESWTVSQLYHIDQRLELDGDLSGSGNYFTQSYSYGDIKGVKFASVGPDEQEMLLEISGPADNLTAAAYEIWAILLDSIKFLPRKVKRPAKFSWLHVFCFLYFACIYADDDVNQDEMDVMIPRFKGWWGSPPTSDEIMKIYDECHEWIEQAKLAPYLMDQEVDFLLKSINDKKLFDQRERDKFVEDLIAIIKADQREHAGEKRFFKKVADSLGL